MNKKVFSNNNGNDHSKVGGNDGDNLTPCQSSLYCAKAKYIFWHCCCYWSIVNAETTLINQNMDLLSPILLNEISPCSIILNAYW